jgi:hypothetical protein
MASSSSETARVEASRAACEEGALSEAPAWEKMLEAPVPMRATGANVSPCTGGGRANEARPQFVGAHGRAALTLGSSGDTGFSPSQVAVVGDAPFVPRSSNIMDLGNGELGLPGGDTSGRLFDLQAGGKWWGPWSWHARRSRQCTDCCRRR